MAEMLFAMTRMLRRRLEIAIIVPPLIMLGLSKSVEC